MTGVKNGKMEMQLNHFAKEIGQIFYKGANIEEPKNWLDAFAALTDAIDKFVPKTKKAVLFLDEFPWMATHKSGLLQALDYVWNRYWSNNPKVKLIICGSSASWIVNKIINNKAGLHNRITRKIQLMPFTLKESMAFLKQQGIQLNKRQVTQLYMTTGGVPYYLQSLPKGLSATQLVEQLAFHHNGLLFNEFDNLFSSLFDEAERYVELLRIIANNRLGTGQKDIIQQSKLFSRGGKLSVNFLNWKKLGLLLALLRICINNVEFIID